jgi:hypothetical protein
MSEPQRIMSLLSQPGPIRYEHFIKRAADTQHVWGLFSDGWALARRDDGAQVFPVWPSPELAALCASGDWAGYQPRDIPIADFLDELLPQLKKDGVYPGIFYTPTGQGVLPEHQQLTDDLHAELAKYE